MPSTVVVDTSVVIAAFRHDPAVLRRLVDVTVVVSPIVLGELYAGAYRSAQFASQIVLINDLIAANTVVSCDAQTAMLYGNIVDLLRQQGSMIPENDMWIAATAWQYGHPLVTRDRHFLRVAYITVELW